MSIFQLWSNLMCARLALYSFCSWGCPWTPDRFASTSHPLKLLACPTTPSLNQRWRLNPGCWCTLGSILLMGACPFASYLGKVAFKQNRLWKYLALCISRMNFLIVHAVISTPAEKQDSAHFHSQPEYPQHHRKEGNWVQKEIQREAWHTHTLFFGPDLAWPLTAAYLDPSSLTPSIIKSHLLACSFVS